MPPRPDPPAPSLPYAPSPPRRPGKSFLLGLLAAPAIYLLLYALLRGTGLFHAYYSQGSWEIEGGTGLYLVDVAFRPLATFEADLQNRLRWLPEPSGG